MTPEERELLNQSIKLAQENNRLLRSIRRSTKIASVLRILYWVIILGTVFGTYFFLQPYFETIREAMTKISTIPAWLIGKQ